MIPGKLERDIFRKERNMSIIVYTKPNCVQCNATKRTMDKHGLDYDTVDLTQDINALNRVKELGFSQAPVVVAGEDAWSGFRPDKIKELSTTVEAVAI
ncbi:glutaredoxin [Mobiluncus mulieris 28-1]|uniref:Glutaredoxin-like protein NrdH n=2 Tax=Mobiluncus mulieris TaxID=2052 RepID=E0QMV6_9ACTO|nr:glutaredoxin [Mobiluncus mulieris ATCC 35243]EEZ92369.1 glutaredoxin [Mobiluncus mulieris 28-1]EFM47123.1 glutaredoxin [Mobiluncus mulieris ATCC 35239]EFN93667.1 glutaredoxin [Mobiluncus mulieris FB024-16]